MLFIISQNDPVNKAVKFHYLMQSATPEMVRLKKVFFYNERYGLKRLPLDGSKRGGKCMSLNESFKIKNKVIKLRVIMKCMRTCFIQHGN